MFQTENEALDYIQTNKTALLAELQDNQIRNIYTNGNTIINIMKDGKRLFRLVYRFNGNKNITEIYRDMIDLKLI